MEGSEVSEDDGYYVFSASDGESHTLPLMIESEPVNNASQEPLKLSGKCMLNICVRGTQMLLKTKLFVIPGTADTLLGKSSSEKLGVLKVGVSVNACEFKDVTTRQWNR